jgi:hypothetical protein
MFNGMSSGKGLSIVLIPSEFEVQIVNNRQNSNICCSKLRLEEQRLRWVLELG